MDNFILKPRITTYISKRFILKITTTSNANRAVGKPHSLLVSMKMAVTLEVVLFLMNLNTHSL